MDFTVLGGQSVTGYIPTYHADVTDEDLKRKASVPEEQPTPEAAEPNLGYMGGDGKPVVYKAPEENTGRIEGKANPVPAADLHDEGEAEKMVQAGLVSPADAQMAADVAMWARGTYGEKQRQLDEDFLKDMNDPDITSDNDRLMERCNQFVTDRISEIHRGGNVLNGMQPFTDGRTYAERIMSYIRDGWKAIETDEWNAVRTMVSAGDYDALKKFYNINEYKDVEDEATSPGFGIDGTTVMLGPQKQHRIVRKTDDEIKDEIGELVNAAASRNFLWMYERMKPDLSDEGAAIVDHAIMRGSFDMNDAAAWKQLCRDNREEASRVKFLVDAARPTEEAWFVDTGYETWHMLRDMVVKAGVGIGENMRRYIGLSSRHIENQLDSERYERMIAEGVPADEAKKQIDELRAERDLADMADEQTRLEMRRAELDIQDMTDHKSWEGYGWLERSTKGVFTTLPYMGVNAIPVVGFTMNVFSHMQDMEDQINQEGGDPTNGRMLRAFGAVSWSAVEKLEFEGMFGRTLTRMEKKNLWRTFVRDGVKKMHKNGWEIAKAYGKEWTVKTGYETFQEGVQGAIESAEHDIGFFNHLDPKQRMDAHKMLRNAVGRFFDDMKESVGTMAGIAVVGAALGTARNVRKQSLYGLDKESLEEVLRRRNSVDAMVDGTWINADVSGEKNEHRAKVLDRLTAIWVNAKDRDEAMAKIRSEFGFNDEQVRRVADWLDLKQTVLNSIAEGAGTDKYVEMVIKKLAGVRHNFVVGNDTVYNPERFFTAFNPNIKVENVEVVDDTKPAPKVKDANQYRSAERLSELQRQKAEAEEGVRNSTDRKERRAWQTKLRKVNRKIATEERKDEMPQQPTRTMKRVTFPMVGADGKTVERHVVIHENNGLPTDIRSEGFAVSVARALRNVGGEFGDIKVVDDESEKKVAKLFEKFAKDHYDAALVYAQNFIDKGHFQIVDEDTGKQLANADGIIYLATQAAIASNRSGNFTLSHEATHGLVRFATDLGLFGDTKAKGYDPAKNDMVMLFRQLFGEPRHSKELFNEEALSDFGSAFMRDEFDFGKYQSVDQRGVAERVADGVVGLLKYAWNQVFHTELVTPRDVNLRREAQIAVFNAIRQGDFRGLSKYAGIKFNKDAKTPLEQKAAKREKEQAQKSTKAPARAAWRLRKRQGVQGDGQPTDVPTGVPGASDEVERLKAENERLMREVNAALAGGGVTVPARAGGQHVVHSPITWIPLKVEWAWMPRRDVVPAGAGSSIQERFRSLNEASQQKLRNRAKRGTFVPERLTADNVGDRGAPIVAGGNICLSGNGRMMLLSMVAERGGYGEYLDAVRAWCRANGVQDCPAEMLDKEPVLVQRVVEGESTEALDKFAMECNRSDHEELTTSEKAKGGVKAITKALMRLYDVPPSGDFMSESNWGFIRAFYKSLGEEVPETMDGRIEPEAGLRVQRAFLAKLLGGEESNDEAYQKAVFTLINTLLAGGDGTATVRNALIRNGAELYALMGNRGSYNVIPELRAAVETYVGWRAAVQRNPSLSLKDYVDTPDFFRVTSPIQDALTRLIEMRYFNAVLKKYNELVSKQDVDAQGMLAIAGAERLTSGQLLAMAEREVVEKDADGNPVTPYVTHEPSWGGYALQPQSAPAVSAPVAEKKPDAKPTKAEREEERKKAQAERDAAMAAHLAQMTPEERAEYDALMAKAETMPTVSEALAAAEEILRKREDDKPFVPCATARGTAVVPNALAPGRGKLTLVKTAKNGNTTERTWNLGAGVWDYLRIPYFTSKLPKPSKQDEAGRGLWSGKPLPAEAQGLLAKYQGKCPRYMGNKNAMTDRTVRTLWEKMSKAERAHYTAVVDCFGGGGCWGLTMALTCFPNANSLIVNEFDEGRLEKIRLLQTRDGSFEAEVRQFFTEKVFGEAFDAAVQMARGLIDFRVKFLAYANSLTLTPDERGMIQAVYDNMMSRLQFGEMDELGNFSSALQLEAAFKEVGEDAVEATELAQAYAARGGSITYVCGDAKNQATFGAKVGADGRVSRTNTEGEDFAVPSGDSVVKVCDPPYYRTTGYNDDGSMSEVGFDENPYGWGYKDTEKMLSGIVDSGSAIVYTDEAWFYGKDFKEQKNDADYGQAGLFALEESLWKREQDVLCGIINNLDHFDVAGDVASRFETLGVHHGHRNERAEGNADAGGNGVGQESQASDGTVHGRGGVDGVHQGVDGMAAGAAAEDGTVHGRGDSSRGRGGVEESADRAVAKEACVQAIEEAVEKAGETVTPDMDTAIRHSVRLVREERMADYARLVSANARAWLTARRKELRKRMRSAGYTDLVWHGTYGDDFNVFHFGDNNGHGVKAAYFTYRRQTAQNYAAIRGMDEVLDGGYDLINTRKFFVNPGKVYEYDEAKTPLDFDGFVAMLKKAYADGYDSVRCHNVLDDQGARLDTNDENMTFLEPEDAEGNGEGDFITDTLIVFDREGNPGANRIKAADAVTFDNGGLPIPFEMRADEDSPDVRFSVKAVGKYAGELRRMAWGLKLGQHRAMEDAARLMSPLIPENAVIVPMPNHDGKPISTMILAYYISGQEDKGIDIVPALEAEPHESNYKHKKRTKGKSTAIVMHRTDAEIPSGRPVVIIDNVVASGATYKAAQKVLPEADLVTLADATRGRVDFDPSLQDLQKRMAENPGNLAASLNAALANPAKMDAGYATREWDSQRIEREASAYADLVNGTRYSLGTRYADRTAYDEDEVRRLAAAGDIDAIAEYFVRNEQMLLSQVRRYGKDLSATDAEDILSSVREGVIRKYVYEGGVPDVPFGAVVVTRIKYLALKTLRGDAGSVRSREMLTNDKPLGDDAEGDSFIDQTPTQDRTWGGEEVHNHSREEAHRRVEEFLSHYSGEKADIFRERTLEGKSALKISRQRGIPEDVVESIVEGMIAEWTSGEYKKLTPASNSGSSEVVSGGRRESGHKTTSFATQDAVIKVHWRIAKKLENCTDYQQIVAKMRLNGMSYAEIAEKTATKYNSVAHALYEVTRSTGIRFGNKRSDATGTKIPARVQQVFDYFGQHPDATQREVADALGIRQEKVSLAVRDGIRLGLGDNRVRQNRMMDRMQTVVKMADEGLGVAEIADKMGITVESVRRLGDRARADLGWAGEITTRRTEFAPRHSLRVVEREVTEDDLRRVFDSEFRHRVVATRSMRKTIDVVTGYAAAQLLGGKEVKVEDLDATLKNVGITGASAPDVLAAAQALADRKRESVKTKVAKADPTLIRELANDNLRQRVGKQIDDAVINGAAIADPEIGVRVERAAQAQARRAMDAAKGFTARQMQQELPISLADAVFAEAEYERTPEEKAKLEEMRKKREEEAEAEKQAAADAGLSLEEYREQLQADRDANTVYVEPDPAQKRYFEELMNRAKAAKEKEDAKEAKRKAKAKAKAEAKKDEDGSDGAEDIMPIETVKRIAPIFGDADTFAMFIAEWCADNVVKRHPEIPNTAQMWRNPVAVRELIKTAQSVLEDLAMDVLGSPAINAARNYADRSIILLAERKTYKGVVHHIAYTYDMIHNQALRLSRRKLVGDLVKAGDKATGAKGRFSATQEMKTRTTFAKTELWWRHLRPFLTMSEERLTEEIARLQGIVDGYNRESADNGYDADNFQEYRDACDKLALANRYGGMVRWMPSKIQAAAAEIMMDLNGRRAEFEAMRDERDADNKRIREAIIKAVEEGGSERYRKEANRLMKTISNIATEYRGQLVLELKNLIRYCKDEKLRQDALDAIDELDFLISRGSEKYRVTYGQGLKEVNDALADIYGSAIAGARHLKEKIPEEVALQIFNQGRDILPTYGQLLQLYASCLQKDYKDNVEKHDRSDQIEIMREALDPKDIAFHAWAIEWYAHNRQELSDAVEEITGLSVASPDNLYCPVRMDDEKDGFDVNAIAWCPVPSALNRRVKHGRDFGEKYNFLDMLQEQCDIRAQLIGYGVAGIRLRDTIVHHDVQDAVRRNVSRKDMKVVSDHVRDVLVQSVERKNHADAWLKFLNVSRKWIAYFYLSGNLFSASKQFVSMAMWAVNTNFRDATRYFASAFTREGWERINELRDTDGYKARYMMGWSEETLNLMLNPTKSKWIKMVENPYRWGMTPTVLADEICSLWMAQGFYGDMKQRMLDLGFNEDEARERAATLTWSAVEQTQQSGRIENMNSIQRKQGGWNALFQFMSSQILQNAFDIQAWKEVKAGTPGAKGRLLRAVLVNHVIIPALLETIAIGWRAIMGEAPLPDDPEDWPPFLKELAFQMLFSQTAPLFFISSIVRTTWDKIVGSKSRYSDNGSAPAVQGALRIYDIWGSLIMDSLTYGAQEFTPFEVEDEVSVEKLQTDILRAADSVLAPVRHIHKAVKNRTE